MTIFLVYVKKVRREHYNYIVIDMSKKTKTNGKLRVSWDDEIKLNE